MNRLHLASINVVVVWAMTVTGCLIPPHQTAKSERAASSGADRSAHRARPGRTERPLEDARLWALACSAILTEWNGYRHDVLAGGDDSDADSAREGLLRWWSVKDKDSLVLALKELEAAGHTQEFLRMGAYIDSLSTTEYVEYRKSVEGNDETAHRVDIARAHYRKYKEKGILAWDLGRYVFLCRQGFLCGYLSEEEAWANMMPVARTIQATFESWEDFGANSDAGLLAGFLLSGIEGSSGAELYVGTGDALKPRRASPVGI